MTNSPRDQSRLIVITILALLVLSRLALARLVDIRPQIAYQFVDAYGYIQMAEKLKLGEAYGIDSRDPGDLFRAPGYPLFLAAVFKLAGKNPTWVILAQLLTSTGTGYLLYQMIRLRFSRQTAILALGVYLVDPTTILWSLHILSETLFTFTLLLAIYLLALWLARGKRYFLAMAGIAIGAGTLIRPIGQTYIVPLVLIVLVWGAGSAPLKVIFKKNTPAAIFLIAGYLLMTQPWMFRNRYVWNCPVISTGPAINLRDWMTAKVISLAKEIPLEQAVSGLKASSDPICPKVRLEYLKTLTEHPLIFLKLYIGGTMATFFSTSIDTGLQLFGASYQMPDLWQPYLDGGLTQVFKILVDQLIKRPLVFTGFIGLLAFQLALYLLAGLGLVKGWKLAATDWRWWLFLIFGTVLIFLAIPGPSGQDRFRVPIQPLLVYLAVLSPGAKNGFKNPGDTINLSNKGDV